jgi:two-component system, OmpR family, sensor histidine kinase TctE
MSMRDLLPKHPHPFEDNTRSLMAGLRTRLLVMLLVPLVLLVLLSAWFDYRTAGSAAIQLDQTMQRLAPVFASSIVAEGASAEDPPIVLLNPGVEDFLKERDGAATWGLATLDGRVIIGPNWLVTPPPATTEPEFHSEQVDGTVYRVMAQRVDTAAGEFVLLLADGSDPRQSWLRALLLKILLPNALLIIAVAFAVSFAVARALKPLTEVARELEQRSPRDLSELDAEHTPPEIRPLVQSLNRLFGMVNAQSESQRRFIADAAHQLRTPLAGLQAQVEAWVQAALGKGIDIYKENKAPAHVNPAANAITLRADELIRLRNATRRTSQLATQLLALSRADTHTLSAQPMQSVDLAQLCRDLLEQLFDEATKLGIDLGVELDSSAPMIATGHEWLLRELMTNLTDNAIRYTALAHQNAAAQSQDHALAAAQVTLVAKHHEGGLLLQVRDNGMGVADGEREKILERFYRVQGTGGEGNGLGLAIAQEIAKLHSAELHLADAEPTAPQGQRGLLVSVYLHAKLD